MAGPGNTKERLFNAAAELTDPGQRAAFLDAACAGDPALRAELEELLRHDHAAVGFLSSPALGPRVAATVTAPSPSERQASQIGPYKLVEQIGEGGMGLVYMAEQERPLRRMVALKIIKPGMDSRQVLARFEAEKQALAMMDHENIARVFDAGTTEAGHPYFVMELVRGIPIDAFCDQKRLTVRQRLELFLSVCQAVQHAHQKGIIHRDLKPSNVLVTMHDATAVPKVIDFGIAKALGPSLADHTLHTGFAQLIGTPLYMSPEQAEMNQLGVDTRSDVYSLGVLLYELLTGTTPFDKETLGRSGLKEMRRILREDEPVPPSARVSARLRKDEGGRMKDEKKTSPSVSSSSRLGRSSFIFHPSAFQELDWIVMKALEKDRGRRYESASAFATDIQRYLDDEPVLAGPPSTMYTFHKFARKHRAALATAVAIAASLILGTTASAWQAVRATTAEAQANANATLAQTSAQEAKEKAQEAGAQRDEAKQQRDEAQKQRDEVQALNEKLAAKEQQLQRTLYAAHMNLAQHAWEEGDIRRVDGLLKQHRPKAGENDLRGFEWYYLYRLCHAELLTLEKHSGDAPGDRSIAYSPDGKRLAYASGSHTDPKRPPGEVRVCDAQTGQELLACKGHTGKVTSVAYSPDGTRLVSASYDQTVKIWDAQTGQELLTCKGHTAWIRKVAFSPDGKRLASAGGNQVKVWDAQTGQELFTLKGHTRQVGSVAYSPDGKRLASGSFDETVKVWNAQTGQELLVLKHTGTVDSVAFSPDGKRLASADDGGVMKVWDAETGQEVLSLTADSQVCSVTFSPDGKRLASAGGRGPVDMGGVITVWDAQTGQQLLTFKGHVGLVTSVVFSPDGTRLASGNFGGTVKIWDATSSPEPRTFRGPTGWHANSVAFSPDGKRLASGGGTWDDIKKAEVAGEVQVWDAQTGKQLLTCEGRTGWVYSVAFSPDGKRLACGSGTWDPTKKAFVDMEVKVWDAQTGQELTTCKGHTAPVVSVAFSPDGTRLASSSSLPNSISPSGDRGEPGEVIVWDAQTGQELLSLKGHSRFVHCVAFSPDGKRLATLSRDNTIKVWDAQTGQAIFTLKPVPAGMGGCVVFSPEGKRLAAGSKVWDAQTGQELLTLEGGGGISGALAFSPDGKRLASARKVWDAQTGQELLSLKGSGKGSGFLGPRVAFSPDGHRLAGSGPDGRLTIWDATPLPEKP